MRITVTPEEFPDYIICFLLQSLVEKDEDSFTPNKNEEYKDLIETLDKKSIKPKLLRKFLKLDHTTKDKYKLLKRAFTPNYNFPESIRILSEESNNIKENQEEKINNVELLKETIKITTQIVTQKYKLNENKLNRLQEDVLEYLKNNGKI